MVSIIFTNEFIKLNNIPNNLKNSHSSSFLFNNDEINLT